MCRSLTVVPKRGSRRLSCEGDTFPFPCTGPLSGTGSRASLRREVGPGPVADEAPEGPPAPVGAPAVGVTVEAGVVRVVLEVQPEASRVDATAPRRRAPCPEGGRRPTVVRAVAPRPGATAAAAAPTRGPEVPALAAASSVDGHRWRGRLPHRVVGWRLRVETKPLG